MLKVPAGDPGESLPLFRSTLLRLGRIAEPGPETHYLKARIQAQLGLAGTVRPSRLAEAGLDPPASQFDAAIASLRSAASMGHRDRLGIAHDSALAPLRARRDFQELLRDLDIPTKSPARGG
jgi:hypothetical protein